MIRRQLPIGIQDFRTIREQEFYYVNKYQDRDEPVHLVGVSISSKDRNLATLEVVPA